MALQQIKQNKPFISNYTQFSTESGLIRRRLVPSSRATSLLTESLERRAAIDVGSGGTKVLIADVDCNTHQIVQVLFEQSFSVPYQTYLESSKDCRFNAEIQEKGLSTFVQIQELLNDYRVSKVTAVATEAFRKAENGTEFAKTVAETTGIPLTVISQKEEGEIGFHSASAASGKNPEELLVFDIGTGSFQIAAEGLVYMQSMGSIPFKNYIIRDVQGKDSSLVPSPNPMTARDWKRAEAKARELGRQAFPALKEQIRELDGSIVGIGRLFSCSIKPLGATPGIVTRKDLHTFISSHLNKTDEELQDPYASVVLSNCILVHGVMKALQIREIQIVETTSTRGLLSRF